jgi:hypothetical protein
MVADHQVRERQSRGGPLNVRYQPRNDTVAASCREAPAGVPAGVGPTNGAVAVTVTALAFLFAL